VSSYNLPNYNPPVFMPPDSVREGIMFLDWTVRPPRSFVLLSTQILLPWCLMNGLSYLDETYREYPLAPSDDLIGFWRS